ncbi:MAG: hypothetical protein AB2A00_16800 [Myxococcota bacterium]
MSQKKAGKAPAFQWPDDLALTVLETHRGRSPTWWLALQGFVNELPPGPRAFWNTVLTNRIIPVDPKVTDAILSDAQGWPGWMDDAPPLEVRTLNAGEVRTLAARFQAEGQHAVVAALQDMARRLRGR